MRTQNKNKQDIYYACPNGRIPIYARNADGTIKYITVDGESVPIETGDTQIGYTTPINIDANISFSGGETQPLEFGTNISDYDATIVVTKGDLELTENALVWYQSTIGWLDDDMSIPDPKTADYRVRKITPSLNEQKYLLARIQK